MNPERFFMPGYVRMRNFDFSNPTIRTISYAPRNFGLFGKITNGIRSVNWGQFLTNTNKTLNVVNQTIPLVRQAAPMVNNVKNVLKIAKVFGRETNNNSNTNYTNINKISDDVNENISAKNNLINKKEVIDTNYPNFFI